MQHFICLAGSGGSPPSRPQGVAAVPFNLKTSTSVAMGSRPWAAYRKYRERKTQPPNRRLTRMMEDAREAFRNKTVSTAVIPGPRKTSAHVNSKKAKLTREQYLSVSSPYFFVTITGESHTLLHPLRWTKRQIMLSAVLWNESNTEKGAITFAAGPFPLSRWTRYQLSIL